MCELVARCVRACHPDVSLCRIAVVTIFSPSFERSWPRHDPKGSGRGFYMNMQRAVERSIP